MKGKYNRDKKEKRLNVAYIPGKHHLSGPLHLVADYGSALDCGTLPGFLLFKASSQGITP